VKQQISRLIERVIAAMAEEQFFGIKSGNGVAQQIAQGLER
jgi:hypothetical protein